MIGVRQLQAEFLQERLVTAEKIGPGLSAGVASFCVLGGFLTFASNSLDPIAVPLLGALVLCLAGLAVQTQRRTGRWERETIVVASAAFLSVVALLLIPEWSYGRDVNAIIHHSFFSSIALFGVGTIAVSHSLYHLLGATPTARDVAVYPLLLLPVVLAVIAYGMIIGRVVDRGIGGLTFDALTNAYDRDFVDSNFVSQPGLRNHILGTFLLVGMTIGIAVPVGIGAGIYMSEYPGKISKLIGFSATMLRAISVFIIGAAALNMVQLVNDRAAGDPLSDVIRGYYYNQGVAVSANGSFLLAACFLSFLIIPVIARATEEGFQSVPREIREGSMALGATYGHGLQRIFWPWAFPMVITGTLIAAAEAAGSTAVLLFISGTGENGVGPLRPTVSLDYMIFQTRYGPQDFVENMRQYQYTAALLLLMITLTLTSAALYIRARARRRYKGIYSS